MLYFFQAHCPNLQVLDLSNLRTVAHATASLHIEKLQEGCQKLRVLRITNSQIALSTATLKEQVSTDCCNKSFNCHIFYCFASNIHNCLFMHRRYEVFGGENVDYSLVSFDTM